MIPPDERLNDQIERWNAFTQPRGERLPGNASGPDAEVIELAALARHLQTMSALQVDPAFTVQLEQRLLKHKRELRRQRTTQARWARLSPQAWWIQPAVVALLSFCILLLLGMSVLLVAMQVTNPDNPLYALKSWEGNTWVSLAGSPADRAELDLQFVRDRLNSLADLAEPTQRQAYQQGLADLNTKMSTAVQSIKVVPAGLAHDHLMRELGELQADARNTLHGLLLELLVPERLATTNVLDLLGAKVPHLKSVKVALPQQPTGQATISITGDYFQPNANLLLNGQLAQASGSLQNGAYIFVTNWMSSFHLQSIGILNPDGTATQTSAITLSHSSAITYGNGSGKGQGKGNSQGKGKGHGNGNGNGKDKNKGKGHGHGHGHSKHANTKMAAKEPTAIMKQWPG